MHQKTKKNKIDPRCLRKLKQYPRVWCPLAVLRLKALRNAERELTIDEESKLPGCPWCVNHQMSNYCFFQYAHDYIDKSISDTEIAHMNNISVDNVKKTVIAAIDKIRNSQFIKEIAATHRDCPVVEERDESGRFNLP